MPPDEKRYTFAEMEAEVESRVAQRLRDAETSETIRKLEAGFERMAVKVDSASQISGDVAKELRATNRLLKAHIDSTGHAAGMEHAHEVDARLDAIDTMHAAQAAAFGVDSMSSEEKSVAAEVLREAAARRRLAPIAEKRDRSRREVWGFVVTAASAGAAIGLGLYNAAHLVHPPP